jgi:hypothetical protein
VLERRVVVFLWQLFKTRATAKYTLINDGTDLNFHEFVNVFSINLPTMHLRCACVDYPLPVEIVVEFLAVKSYVLFL